MDDGTGSEPLGAEEQVLWRALGRLMHVMPRLLDEDMTRACGISMTDYAVLVNLAEAPEHQLRMVDLAAATALSPSRITRVVDDLRRRGLVRRAPHASDARGAVAVLTADGLASVRAAQPQHVASARRRVLDHVPAGQVAALAAVLDQVASSTVRSQARFDGDASGGSSDAVSR